MVFLSNNVDNSGVAGRIRDNRGEGGEGDQGGRGSLRGHPGRSRQQQGHSREVSISGLIETRERDREKEREIGGKV